MLKKHFLFILLYFAYSMVLGHTIVPHHHHDKYTSASCHQVSECADEDGHHGLSHAFSFFTHSSSDQHVFMHSGDGNNFLKKSQLNEALCFNEIYFTPPGYYFDVKQAIACAIRAQQSHLLSRSLRAPPFSVV